MILQCLTGKGRGAAYGGFVGKASRGGAITSTGGPLLPSPVLSTLQQLSQTTPPYLQRLSGLRLPGPEPRPECTLPTLYSCSHRPCGKWRHRWGGACSVGERFRNDLGARVGGRVACSVGERSGCGFAGGEGGRGRDGERGGAPRRVTSGQGVSMMSCLRLCRCSLADSRFSSAPLPTLTFHPLVFPPAKA